MKSFYLLILLCACSLSAQTHNYPFQSEAPIANFTLNENDTLRYEGHYRFENAYQVIYNENNKNISYPINSPFL